VRPTNGRPGNRPSHAIIRHARINKSKEVSHGNGFPQETEETGAPQGKSESEEEGSCSEEFVYGQDGKPYFVAGPYDSPWRCRQIIRTLTDRCGPDGFHYLMPLGATGAALIGGDELLLDDDTEFDE
jgi:hypothetical protein